MRTVSNLLPTTSNSLPCHKQPATGPAQPHDQRTLASPSEARLASFPLVHLSHLQSVECGMRKSTEALALDVSFKCVVSVRAQCFLKWICKKWLLFLITHLF